MAKEKKRLDQILVERGLFTGRDAAKAAIMAGEVWIGEQRADKPGQNYPEDVNIRLTGERLPFVSRGGLKLAKAVQVFDLDMTGLRVLDIGASTGGFTDCALQNGAAHVYAVDVGYGQLAWKLRQDERVTVMEKTNARYLDAELISPPVDMIVVDASFISLKVLLPSALQHCLKEDGLLVALIKPQFEAGRDKVGKKGVVRDAATHLEVVQGILAACPEMGVTPIGLDFSPITGPEGNIEFLLLAKKGTHPQPELQPEAIVAAAAEHLGK